MAIYTGTNGNNIVNGSNGNDNNTGLGGDDIEWLCAQVGLQLVALKRIRIGRVPMAALPAGQWRYLPAGERF